MPYQIGRTALGHAIGNAEIVSMLLEKGADTDSKDLVI